jgi:Holliday junction DNA helicase RuvA
MIALLRGKIIEKQATTLILDVNGVGYEVFIPISTFDKLPLNEQEEVTLKIHTHVREDALMLYGFYSADEKRLFELLISVNGIGAKAALNVLSCISITIFCNAIINGDIKTITTINGIGKKTAERLIVELKDKIKSISITDNVDGDEQNTPSTNTSYNNNAIIVDTVTALEKLGYKKDKAEKVVLKLLKELPDSEITTSKLTITALKHLN